MRREGVCPPGLGRGGGVRENAVNGLVEMMGGILTV